MVSNAYWGYGNRDRNETESNAERPRASNCKLDREIARNSVFGPHAIPLPSMGRAGVGVIFFVPQQQDTLDVRHLHCLNRDAMWRPTHGISGA